MADESKSPSKGKAAGKSAGDGPSHLAPVQGDYTDDRPAAEQPGTPEHLGGPNPYQGAAPEGE